MKYSEIIRLLEQDGWYIVRTKGSHRQYKHLIEVPFEDIFKTSNEED